VRIPFFSQTDISNRGSRDSGLQRRSPLLSEERMPIQFETEVAIWEHETKRCTVANVLALRFTTKVVHSRPRCDQGNIEIDYGGMVTTSLRQNEKIFNMSKPERVFLGSDLSPEVTHQLLIGVRVIIWRISKISERRPCKSGKTVLFRTYLISNFFFLLAQTIQHFGLGGFD
jgi:hypothetical protein